MTVKQDLNTDLEEGIPDLSIVIISFNTAQMTLECLQSVYDNQAGLSLQVIVVDNDSKDNSVAEIRRCFPDVDLIANNYNAGFAAANNQGFEIAKSEHVLLLNSDTLVLGNVLKASLEYVKNDPEVGAFGCRVLNTDRTVQRTCSQYPTNLNLLLKTLGLDHLTFPRWFGRYFMRDWQRDSERDVDVVSGCYLLVPAQVIQTVGSLDEDYFFFGEEADWCLRIKKSGWKVRFSPVGEIIHHGSVSAKKLQYKRDMLLTNGLIRFHVKNYGNFSAGITWLILFVFNLTRAVLWSCLGVVKKGYRERAKHFLQIVGHFGQAWPRKKLL